MKKLSYIIGLIAIIVLSSCNEPIIYPRYSLKNISYIPDSLRIEHREYILNTSKHNKGENLSYIKKMSYDLFKIETLGLKVELDGLSDNDYFLREDRMDDSELRIFDSLRNSTGRKITRVELKTK